MIRDAAGLIRADVDKTLTALALSRPDLDAAAVRLAREYADAMDRAAWTAEAVDALIDRVHDSLPYDDAQAIITELHRLAIKLEAHNVLAQLGPKLMVTLDALGATPKARKANRPTADTPTRPGKLHSIREGHDAVG